MYIGNEPTSREVLLHFIDYVLNNQNNDSSVDYIMKNMRLHILVSMNPGNSFFLIKIFYIITLQMDSRQARWVTVTVSMEGLMQTVSI